MQDRLVKELRLAGAATLAEGNALLPAFIADYNTRFAKAPANDKDLHRPLRAADDLDDAFAWKEERTLSQALTLQYDKVMFILEPSEQAKPAPQPLRQSSESVVAEVAPVNGFKGSLDAIGHALHQVVRVGYWSVAPLRQ